MQSNSAHFDYIFKINLVGEVTVGKTGLFNRIIFDEFRDNEMYTTHHEYGVRTMKIQEKSIKLQIWDTAGQEIFRSISKAYYRGSVGLIFVYDIANRESFTNLDRWISEARQNAEPYACMVLIGNKSDLEIRREVSTEEGLQKAQELGCKFAETSAKDSIDIASAFHDLASDIFEKAKNLEKEEILQKSIPRLAPLKLKTSLSGGKDIEKNYAACC